MFTELDKLDAVVIGVSMDSLESHRAFAAAHKLQFPLLADTDGALAAKYGVKARGSFLERVSFIIDANGVIVRVYPRVVPNKHAAEVVEALKELTKG